MESADALYIEVNGELLAESVSVDTWTDAAGKRHASGESILAQGAKPEFRFAAGAAVNACVIRASTGDRVSFDGVVSRVGMRHHCGGHLLSTFQIDEQ